jgi:transposase
LVENNNVARVQRVCGGSTAVAVALRGRRLLAAWAGDSLALLAKRMRLLQLVLPHKPDRQVRSLCTLLHVTSTTLLITSLIIIIIYYCIIPNESLAS